MLHLEEQRLGDWFWGLQVRTAAEVTGGRGGGIWKAGVERRGRGEGAGKTVFAELDLSPLSSPLPITGLSILGISSPPF